MKQTEMDCVVIGGCADGLLLRDLRVDAQMIELQRPDYIKPLASALQSNPEVIKQKDVYEVHPIGLRNTEESGPIIFGIAVVADKSLTWAFSQLVISHVENTTNKLVNEGLVEKH
jgi:hypothetical protein